MIAAAGCGEHDFYDARLARHEQVTMPCKEEPKRALAQDEIDAIRACFYCRPFRADGPLDYEYVDFANNVSRGFVCDIHEPLFGQNFITCNNGSLGDPNLRSRLHLRRACLRSCVTLNAILRHMSPWHADAAEASRA